MLDYIFDMYDKKARQTGFMKHYLTLFSIVEGLESKNTFEFGTGISTKVIIDALRITNGKHISCDVRDIKDTGLSQLYLEQNEDIWTYLQQDSRTVDFEKLGCEFDLVLHDGSHVSEIVEKDLFNILPFIKNNGMILLHDTIFEPKLEEIIKYTLNLWDAEILTLPYSNGLTILKLSNPNIPSIKTTWEKNK